MSVHVKLLVDKLAMWQGVFRTSVSFSCRSHPTITSHSHFIHIPKRYIILLKVK